MNPFESILFATVCGLGAFILTNEFLTMEWSIALSVFMGSIGVSIIILFLIKKA